MADTGERWGRLIGEFREQQANEQRSLEAARAHPQAGPRPETSGPGNVLATLVVVAALAWAAIGVWLTVTDRDVPVAYWVPLLIVLPAAAVATGAAYFLGDRQPGGQPRHRQDFAKQSWPERRKEIASFFRWKTLAGREWHLWLLDVFVFVPMATWGVVVGPPKYDRLASSLLLALTTAIGWLGLKALDARIARRKARNASGGCH